MADQKEAAPLLKDILGPQALVVIADAGAASSPSFDRAAFLKAASAGLDGLSIMERVRHIADALGRALPVDYPAALDIVLQMAPHLTHGFQAVAVTEYVARYGLDDFERSLKALTALTRFGTAEFAIRPFLARDAARTLTRMLQWTGSDDAHVRRLASEGCRPRLPWAARIPALKTDPTLGAPIIEALKADPSIYVRKSVANHLNDIAKERPDWVLTLLEGWAADDPGTVWIVRHALRTLIKQGDPRALALIGAGHGADVDLLRFSIAPETLRLGEPITVSAGLRSTAAKAQRLVVDYRIHYAREGRRTAAKVFKLKTFSLGAGETVDLNIRQTIRDFSTRRHHPGEHGVELIVNGQTVARAAFTLLA